MHYVPHTPSPMTHNSLVPVDKGGPAPHDARQPYYRVGTNPPR